MEPLLALCPRGGLPRGGGVDPPNGPLPRLPCEGLRRVGLLDALLQLLSLLWEPYLPATNAPATVFCRPDGLRRVGLLDTLLSLLLRAPYIPAPAIVARRVDCLLEEREIRASCVRTCVSDCCLGIGAIQGAPPPEAGRSTVLRDFFTFRGSSCNITPLLLEIAALGARMELVDVAGLSPWGILDAPPLLEISTLGGPPVMELVDAAGLSPLAVGRRIGSICSFLLVAEAILGVWAGPIGGRVGGACPRLKGERVGLRGKS